MVGAVFAEHPAKNNCNNCAFWLENAILGERSFLAVFFLN